MLDLTPYRQSLQIPEAQTAIDLLEKTQDFDLAIDQLIQNQFPKQDFGTSDRPRLWSLLKQRLQQEICGDDDSFRTLLGDLKKNPGNATIAIAALTYLINIAGLPIPIEASLATAILLRIADIGLDVFCEWSTPQAPKP